MTPGSRIYAALDLGSTRDMSALVLIAEDIGGTFDVEPFYWLPGNVEQRESEDRAPYREWAHEGQGGRSKIKRRAAHPRAS